MLPPLFDDALRETETVRQSIREEEFAVENAKVAAKNRRNRVDEEAKVILNQKGALANATVNEWSAKRETFIASTNAELESLKFVQTQTSMTGDDMVNYIWLSQLAEGGDNVHQKIHAKPPSLVTCIAAGNCPR